MKLTANALFLLLLSGTLTAQSKGPQPKVAAFPSQITHVVVIVQENRTPDNLFHFLSPLCPIPQGASGLNACTPSPVTSSCYDVSPCGLSNKKAGTVLPVTLKPIVLNSGTDPSHSHSAFNLMCDPDPANGYACRNDGAHLNPTAGGKAYSYVENPAITNSDGSPGHLLDPYLTYAEQYGWANFMYQTNQGPSYPAHQFIFSGTSARSASDDANSIFVSENFSVGGTAGCLAGSAQTSSLLSPLLGSLGPNCTAFDNNSVQECLITNTALSYPNNPVGSFCDDKWSMATVLDPTITWKYYAPAAGSIWTAPDSIQAICVPQFVQPTKHPKSKLVCTGAEWNANVDVNNKGTDILRDIANCNLSNVVWAIPNGTWSDHAGLAGDTTYGPSWIAAIINAIGQNPTCAAGTTNAGETFWNNTAIVVTWDDWGGWSDNQTPPILSPLPCASSNCQGDYQYGFRVPLLVVSAYTPQGYISNNAFDFGSILRMIEGVYGITEGALGVADARATNDLSDFFQGSFRSYTPVPAQVDASYFLGQAAQAGPPAPPDNDGGDD